LGVLSDLTAGAGVSAAAGIQPFRGIGGIYKENKKLRDSFEVDCLKVSSEYFESGD
jgi:NAD-dependent SIR2 family protein deacetylase